MPSPARGQSHRRNRSVNPAHPSEGWRVSSLKIVRDVSDLIFLKWGNALTTPQIEVTDATIPHDVGPSFNRDSSRNEREAEPDFLPCARPRAGIPTPTRPQTSSPACSNTSYRVPIGFNDLLNLDPPSHKVAIRPNRRTLSRSPLDPLSEVSTMAEPLDEPLPQDFRVLITGDRNWRCRPIAREVVARLKAKHGPALVVVHGGGLTGVDREFAEAAELQRVRREAHPADSGRWGDRGESVRNAEMVASGINLAVAVHRTLKRSRGTRDCVAKCLAAGIPVWLVDSEEVKPRRIREV